MKERTYRPVKPLLVLALVLMTAVLAAAVLLTLHAGNLLKQTLDGRRGMEPEPYMTQFSLHEQMMKSQADARVRGWMSVVQREEAALDTARGTLAASLFSPIGAQEDAPWALVLHGGLGTDRTQVLDVACELSLAGYRVLTPDLYAHGASDGSISSLGLADAQDVAAWVQWIIDRDAEARIVLFGQDEGGAAVLLAAAQGLPVYAAAADSTYTSVQTRMLDLLESGGRLNKFLLSAAYRRQHGMDAGEGELTQQLVSCTLPLLILHGTGDADVPAWHGEDLASAGQNAQLLFVEGAAHGMARYADSETYYGALLRFFEQNLTE